MLCIVGLKGVEISGEKVFEVTAGSSENYKWDSHGFQLTVPNGALPPGVTASVAVRSIVAGPFQLPENSELISAIYWISSTHAFMKKVTVHLQHCAIICTEEELGHCGIIIGKCSQDPPYQFAIKDGEFSPHSQTASISMTQFSILGAIWRWFRGETHPAQRQYTAMILHKQLARITWEIVLVVVQEIPPFVEVHEEGPCMCLKGPTCLTVYLHSIKIYKPLICKYLSVSNGNYTIEAGE